MSQSHRWEYGPVGQLVVSLELPVAAAAVVASSVAAVQLGDRSVAEEQLFVDIPAAAGACLEESS